MNLKLGQKLLVIGGVLVAIGVVLVASTFLIIGQSSYSFSTSTQTVSVGESFSKTIEAQAGTNMTVAVEVQPPEVPMQLQVRQPGGDIISNISFNNRTSATFTPIIDGEYTIIIANIGNEQVSVNMLAGTNPFFALDDDDDDGNQQQANVALGAMAISGPILGGIGFVIIVIGAIVYFFRDRRRARRT
jgi:uncharacterized membrane protein